MKLNENLYKRRESEKQHPIQKNKKNGDEAAILPFISTTQQFYLFLQYGVNKHDKRFRIQSPLTLKIY